MDKRTRNVGIFRTALIVVALSQHRNSNRCFDVEFWILRVLMNSSKTFFYPVFVNIEYIIFESCFMTMPQMNKQAGRS